MAHCYLASELATLDISLSGVAVLVMSYFETFLALAPRYDHATVPPICEMCRHLIESLQDVRETLQDASTRLSALPAAGRPDSFQDALRKVQSLQMESRVLKAEVERHKAEHSATQN
jgi:hypothetical protein